MKVHEILKEELSKRNQFKNNFLTREIIDATGCTVKRALEIQDGLCNLLSFWAILFAQGLLLLSFMDFYIFLVKNNYASEDGWLKIDKPDLLHAMRIDAQVIKYNKFTDDRQPGECYQIAINNKHHFIASCVNDDLSVSVFDTNNRGCPEDLEKALKKDKIDWIKYIG
jgi:hypothetical protein